MADIDWLAIRAEYASSTISYRELAKKYGINPTTIAKRASAEKWVEARKKHASKMLTKTLNRVSAAPIDYRAELYRLAYKVAGQLNAMTDEHPLSDLAAIGIKPRDITGAIKDLEDILHVKSAADLQEQEARIANLRKQADSADGPGEIKVSIEGDLGEYAK